MKNDKNQYQRQNARHTLALAWLKEHRMDVYEAIQAELDKRFPLARRRIVKNVLPNALRNLK
jgi:hypothetical protein